MSQLLEELVISTVSRSQQPEPVWNLHKAVCQFYLGKSIFLSLRGKEFCPKSACSLARNVQRGVWYGPQDGFRTFWCASLQFSCIKLHQRTVIWKIWLQARQDGFKIDCFFIWLTNSMMKTSWWSTIKSWLTIRMIRFKLNLEPNINWPWLSRPIQLSLASIHFLRNHFQEATDIYKRLLLESRDSIALNVYVALCYYKLGTYKVPLTRPW